MLYTEQTRLAMRIAYDAHAGQNDRGGVPYIYHPIHLAEQMETETAVCAALLHDVAEDTDIDFEALSGLGVMPCVIETVRLLTHREEDDYLEYIRAIRDSGNADAVAVKLADLHHNSNPERLNEPPTERTKQRMEKYARAIGILTGKP